MQKDLLQTVVPALPGDLFQLLPPLSSPRKPRPVHQQRTGTLSRQKGMGFAFGATAGGAGG